ncbi:gliding motility-associated C-terminal domain-containing protein [bacterium]|nr:gliding motility-associated C-terminal domain-containing protein [bacterium]
MTLKNKRLFKHFLLLCTLLFIFGNLLAETTSLTFGRHVHIGFSPEDEWWYTSSHNCYNEIGAVDIVFVVDNSGSMESPILEVADEIERFAFNIAAIGYAYSFGLVTYCESINYPHGYSLIDDESDFADIVRDNTATGGGAERHTDAMVGAILNMNWHPGRDHIIIQISDECDDASHDYSVSDANTIIDGWDADDTGGDDGTIYFISNNVGDFGGECDWEDFENYAVRSDGLWYEFGDRDMDEIFDQIVDEIADFTAIYIDITNNSGTTFDPLIVELIPEAGIVVGDSVNPHYVYSFTNGSTRHVEWDIHEIPAVFGYDDCFLIFLHDASYSYTDTVVGCLFVEDCQCPGPEAFIICPELSARWTACDYQEVVIGFTSFMPIDPTSICVNVEGTIYCYGDAGVSWNPGSSEFTIVPPSPWPEDADVDIRVVSASDNTDCDIRFLPESNFHTDFTPPSTGWWEHHDGTVWPPTWAWREWHESDPEWDPPCRTTVDPTDHITLDALVFDSLAGLTPVDNLDNIDDLLGIDFPSLWTALTSLLVTVNGLPWVPSALPGTFSRTINYDTRYLNPIDPPGHFFVGGWQIHFQARADTLNMLGLFRDSMRICLHAHDMVEGSDPGYDGCMDCVNETLWCCTYFLPTSGPSVDAGPDQMICYGDSVQIGGSPTAEGGTPPYTYVWSPPSGLSDRNAPNPWASPETTTTYRIDVTDTAFETGADVVTVTVSNPQADAGRDTAFCEPTPYTLGGYPAAWNGITPYRYNWSPPIGLDYPNVEHPIATPTSSQTYILTVTDDIDCEARDTVTILVSDMVVDAGRDTTICRVEGDIYLGGDPTASGGVGSYTYTWSSIPPGYFSSLPNPWAPLNESVIFIVTVEDSIGCIGVDSMSVTVSDIDADAGNDIFACALDPVVLGGSPTALGGIGRSTFSWESDPPGFYSTESNPTVYPEVTTYYMVTVTDEAGCEAYDSMLVTVSGIWADAGPDTTVCGSDTVTIGGIPPAGDGIGSYIYSWTSDPVGFRSAEENPSVSPDEPTYYFLEVFDEAGCYAYDTVLVYVAENPVATVVYPDPCGGITSCEYQGFAVLIQDASADIDESSIQVGINGDTYYTTDTELSWYEPDSLHFTPSVPWDHGETVIFTLSYAANIYGCAANVVTCTVVVDIEPPLPVNPNPAPMDTVFNPSPPINIQITDVPAGIDSAISFDPANITVTVNGTAVTAYTINWNGLMLEILGLTFADGDSVQVCLNNLVDAPDYDYCPPNDTAFCWSFIVSISEPYAWLIEPLDLNGDGRTISACTCQAIIIGINDADGIDPNTIVLIVEGARYEFPDLHLTYVGSVLTYTPDPPCWADSQVVHFSLVQANDIYGFELTDTLTDSFLVDLTPPVYFSESPHNASTIYTLIHDIYVSIIDSVSGYTNIDSIQLRVVVNGTDTTFHDSLFIPGFTFNTGDSVEVCALNAHDNPDYCGPNALDWCWWFRVAPCDMSVMVTASDTTVCAGDSVLLIPVVTGGMPPYSYAWRPTALVYLPDEENPYGYDPGTSNEVWYVCTVTDSLGCIAIDSLLVIYSHIEADAGPDDEICPHDTVALGDPAGTAFNGVPPYQYAWTNDIDPGWTSSGEHPLVSPDLTTTYYLEAMDSIGCYAYDTVTIVNEFETVGDFGLIAPPPGSLLPPGDITIEWEEAPGTPPIYYTLYIDDTIAALLIDSTHYTVNYPCGETHTWYVQAINVCGVSIWDYEFCSDTLLPECLEYLIDEIGYPTPPIWELIDSCCDYHPPVYYDTFDYGGDPDFSTYPCDGPVATIIRPLPNTYSACDPESIIVAIEDTDGVVESTIELVVNGTPYNTTMSELRWEDPYLIFKPLTSWSNGDIINVSLISADDTYGNPLQHAPVEWSFIIDYSPPVVWNTSPPCGDTLYSDRFTLYMMVFDSLSGLEPESIYIEVGSDRYYISHSCITWDGDSILTFDPACAGYTFSDGDIFEYCLHAEDTPDYCAANELDTCCSHYISMECSLQATAGPDQYLCPDMEVMLGCDPTAWSGVPPYTYSWTPPTDLSSTTVPNPIASPDTTSTYILTVTDSMGCVIIDSVTVFMEYEPPGPFDFIRPAAGASLRPGDIILEWEDAPGSPPMYYDLYIDGLLVEDMMDSTHYTVNYPCGHTHSWAVRAYNFCVSRITLCGEYDSIFVDTAWSEPIDVMGDPLFSTWPCEGPVADIRRPMPNTFSACDPESILIYLIGTDTLIDQSTIELSVNSVLYHTSDEQLRYEGDTMLIFNPDPAWENADTVRVILLHAIDYNGVDLGTALNWRFTLDYSPPMVWDFDPPCGSTIFTDHFMVDLKVYDSLSGLNESELIFISLGSDTFRIGDACLTWTDDSMLHFDPICAGYEFVHGSVFSYCIHSEDTPDYCEPNVWDTCCAYYISMECSLQASAGPDQYVCPENEVMLGCDPTAWSGVPPYTYSWTPTSYLDDPNTPNPYASPPTTTTYILEVRDSMDCVIYDTVVVYVDYEPIGPFALLTPVNGALLEPGDVMFDWEDAPGTRPILYDLLIDGNLVEDRMDSTHYIITYPCGHNHYWEVLAYNYCLNSIHFCEYGAWDTIMYYDTIYYDPVSDSGYGDPEFSTYPCEGPVGIIIHPDSNTFTACDPDTIVIELIDTSLIVESTIILEVQGVQYTTAATQLEWNDPYLIFVPDPAWEDGEHVHVRLLEAWNRLPAPLENVVDWWFTVDLSPPVPELFNPQGAMIRNPQPDIIIHLVDSLSGVDITSVIVWVDGIDLYPDTDFDWDPIGGIITYFPPDPFTPGDTVCISIYSCDQPDYCAPNCDSTTWCIRIEPFVACLVHPNPFTPNNDNINEYTIFDYPNMFSQDAVVSIYNIRNVKVWEKKVEHIDNISDFMQRSWNGKDSKGKDLPEGIYIYTIEVDKKIECNGTVILAR